MWLKVVATHTSGSAVLSRVVLLLFYHFTITRHALYRCWYSVRRGHNARGGMGHFDHTRETAARQTHTHTHTKSTNIALVVLLLLCTTQYNTTPPVLSHRLCASSPPWACVYFLLFFLLLQQQWASFQTVSFLMLNNTIEKVIFKQALKLAGNKWWTHNNRIIHWS